MTIKIGAETQKLLDKKLKTGEYGSTDELIHAALTALEIQSAGMLDEATLDEIDKGEDDLANGRVHDWKQIRARFQANMNGKKGDE